ncbi:MAG: hypothetical protein KKB59_18285 [Spirochaetes bacterium]|nr:hypothetical protein [Spirochaetota bacterium]
MGTWRLMGQYDAETKTYSAFAGTGLASPYTPDFSGTLKKLRAIVNSDAATTLIEAVQIKLTCNTFRPNSMEIVAQGNGLQTAPAMAQLPIDYDLGSGQPVQAGVPITMEGRNITADTPIGVNILLIGYFE